MTRATRLLTTKLHSVLDIPPFYCTTVWQCDTFDFFLDRVFIDIRLKPQLVVSKRRMVIVKRGFDSSSISRSGSSGSSGVHVVVGSM